MHKDLRIFKHFKYSLDDAFFGVYEIAADKDHPEFDNLQLDIKQLNPSVVKSYILNRNYDRFIDNSDDIYSQQCLMFIVDIIQHGIAQERLIELQILGKESAPYNSKNLSSLKMDSNNLVSTKDFVFIPYGYRYNDKIYHLSPMINGSNSSYWISQTIMKYTYTKKLDFKIRLDPFIEIHHSKYFPIGYKMTIYGKPLNWERLKSLREDEHGRWMNDDLSNNNITDYVWKPTTDELHFTCEELPKEHEINYRGSRYFHAIFDKKSGLIKHCDGAIRIYSDIELDFRLKHHVRNSEVRKIGKRVKIFQLDEIIDQEIFIDLITNYMVWNHDVIKYFNSAC